MKCTICNANTYPTPTGWQCAAYSDHKGETQDIRVTVILRVSKASNEQECVDIVYAALQNSPLISTYAELISTTAITI